ncbi:MAG: hypothetical protein JO267_12585 [Alphaproteobacteria bacterium]|nr:hypothetical protein [Alphaproteobacteria bacterium]
MIHHVGGSYVPPYSAQLSASQDNSTAPPPFSTGSAMTAGSSDATGSSSDVATAFQQLDANLQSALLQFQSMVGGSGAGGDAAQAGDAGSAAASAGAATGSLPDHADWFSEASSLFGDALDPLPGNAVSQSQASGSSGAADATTGSTNSTGSSSSTAGSSTATSNQSGTTASTVDEDASSELLQTASTISQQLFTAIQAYAGAGGAATGARMAV